MLVKISRNPSRSLVYGYSSWAEADDLHGLHRGSYHVTCRLKFYYKLYMNEKDKKMIETGMQQDK